MDTKAQPTDEPEFIGWGEMWGIRMYIGNTEQERYENHLYNMPFDMGHGRRAYWSPFKREFLQTGRIENLSWFEGALHVESIDFPCKKWSEEKPITAPKEGIFRRLLRYLKPTTAQP